MENIRRILDLSTAHITPETCELLDTDSFPYLSSYPEGEYGVFVRVPSELEPPYNEIPTDILTVLKFASQNDCDWVLFDRDAEEIADLPTYSWQ